MSDEIPTQPARLKPIWPVRLAVGLIDVVVFAVIASVLPDNRWLYLGPAILFVVSSAWIYGKTRRERLVVVAFVTALAVAGYGALWTQSGHEIIAGTVPGVSCPTESSGATNLGACTRSSVAADAPQCESLMARWLAEAGGSSQRVVSDFGPTVERSGLAVPTSDAPVPPPGNTECVR
jgi:hypothetical protein